MANWYFQNIFIPSPIFFFNLNSDFDFPSFKPCNWFGHKSFKSRTFNACKWPKLAKNKIFSQNFSLKINRLNQLITKLACLMQHWRKYKPKYWWRFRVLKLKRVNSKMSRSRSFRGSLMIPITMLCIVMFAERKAQILLAKPNLSLEKS